MAVGMALPMVEVMAALMAVDILVAAAEAWGDWVVA